MKKYILLVAAYSLCLAGFSQSGSVGIGTVTPNASAALEISSNNKGMLIPRLSQAEINVMANPPQGLVVYNTNTNSFYFYNGTAWVNITHSGIVTGTQWHIPRFIGNWGLGNGMMIDNGTGVSLKIPLAEADPSAILDVQSTTKGMLIPRMTTIQRNAISSPVTGLLVFDNTTESFWFKNSNNWMELVDTAANVWKKASTHAYLGVSGNVGIGTTTPGYDLHINRPNATLGFTDAQTGTFSGSVTGNSLDLIINSSRAIFGGTPGNLILQSNSGFVVAGNVGIGTTSPAIKLQVEGGTDASGTGGGFLQLGSSSAANIGFDNNEIQARNNGTAAKLFLQASGGDLQIGGSNNIIINEGYQVYRNRPLSTNADLLPVAYAKMDGGSAAALSGTGNLSIQRIAAGEYRLVFLGETNLYTNRHQYTILVTANSIATYYNATAYIHSDNSIYVYITRPEVSYTNSTCNGCTFSYVNGTAYAHYDSEFSIVIYKM